MNTRLALTVAAIMTGKYGVPGRKIRIVGSDAQGLPMHVDIPALDERRLEKDVSDALVWVRDSYQI